MKTKAEKYAEGYRCPATNENEYCKHDIISAYNNGYTQCQEDMADKKYTEEDLHTILRLRKEWYSHTDKNVVRDFINSLNKQD